jgi:uncharacterized protein YjbJ (UPF0337 family)
MAMDKDRIIGSAEQAKGAVKEAAGKALGDKKLETEGKTDKAAGEDRSGWAIISSAWLRLAENSSCDASGFIRASGR